MRTNWQTSDIWLRRAIELKADDFAGYRWKVFYDEDAEVYLNGKKVAVFHSYTEKYKLIPLDQAAIESLNSGANVLAVHCHNTAGAQGIDVDIIPPKK